MLGKEKKFPQLFLEVNNVKTKLIPSEKAKDHGFIYISIKTIKREEKHDSKEIKKIVVNPHDTAFFCDWRYLSRKNNIFRYDLREICVQNFRSLGSCTNVSLSKTQDKTVFSLFFR